MLVFNEMQVQKAKSSVIGFFSQRGADGFNSGVKGLITHAEGGKSRALTTSATAKPTIP
jgi:hypothetical protein